MLYYLIIKNLINAVCLILRNFQKLSFLPVDVQRDRLVVYCLLVRIRDSESNMDQMPLFTTVLMNYTTFSFYVI